MRYRSSKPSECEAMQWCSCMSAEAHAAEIVAWVNANGGETRYLSGATCISGCDKPRHVAEPRIAIRTINGWAYAAPGHYVVMGTATFCVHGDDHDGFCRRDFYPCDPETFERRWEAADSVVAAGETQR